MKNRKSFTVCFIGSISSDKGKTVIFEGNITTAAKSIVIINFFDHR